MAKVRSRISAGAGRALVVAVLGACVLPRPSVGQEDVATSFPGWSVRAGFGLSRVFHAYGDVLDRGVGFDLGLTKDVGEWRVGGGLLLEGLRLDPPFQGQPEWARVDVFGSLGRSFRPDYRLRPYVEVRPALVRMHPRSLLFSTIDTVSLRLGRNPTPSTQGIGLTVGAGLEVHIQESFAFSFGGTLATYSTGAYDMSPIGASPKGHGSEWGASVGFLWSPLARGPGTEATRRLLGGGEDAWGVPRSWGWAAAQTLGINVVASVLNEYTRDERAYPPTPQSWADNLDLGWKFDDNKFSTNQIVHPFNGAAYFNSARSNGLGFWSSSGFALLGAFVWECCGETQPMSWNDMLSTSFGGISQGELVYRTSSLLLDNTSRGTERAFREIAASVVNPVRGFNRLVSGRARSAERNPESPYDRRPPLLLTQLSVGARTIGLGKSITNNTNRYAFLDYSMIYGDPFENERRGPFDRFDAYLQLNAGDKTGVGRLQIRGDLWSWQLGRTTGPGARHTFAIAHDFDYINNEAYQFGGQGLGVALFSRFGAFERRFITRLSVMSVVGAAVNSDYAFLAEIPSPRAVRDYDYGTGLGLGFEGLLTESARTTARIDYRYVLMSVFNGSLTDPTVGLFDFGSDARHQVHRGAIEVLVAISENFSVGIQSSVFFRDSVYDDPDLISRTQRNPELKVYVSRVWR